MLPDRCYGNRIRYDWVLVGDIDHAAIKGLGTFGGEPDTPFDKDSVASSEQARLLYPNRDQADARATHFAALEDERLRGAALEHNRH
eukprot:7758793-Alexandrium_andersonii.AAC.1